MGKSKTEKKANGVKPVTSTVKEGRVAKASQTPVAKAKEAVKAAVIKSDKKGKSKKKAKEPTPEPDTSNSDTDADSESSVSSDDEEAAKPAPKSSVKTNGAVKPAAVDSETSDSSSSESDDEAPAVKPKANGVNGAPKKAVGAKDLTSDSSESESDSESESEAETPAIKAAAKVATDSSSDSDDSSADSSESESEAEAPAKVNGTAIKAAVSDSSDDSDSGSDSEGSDSEEEDAKAAAEAPSKKRKADTETTPAAKKAKPDVNGFNDKRASKNLFVGNIAWGVDEDALAKEFEEYGDIVGCRIMTDRDSGRSKGFGYVEFETVEMAVQAYNGKQGAELGGRTLNVDYSEPRPQRDNNASYSNDRASRYGDKKSEPSDTVFLGNLSFDANNDMISEMFQQFGEITRVSLPTDRESGQLKGFGYVGFSSVDEATAAIAELQGADVAGRPIRLDFAGPRPENNDSPRGGRGGFGGRGGGRGGGGRGGGGFGGRGGGRGRGGDRGFGGRGGGRGGRGGSFQSTNRGGFGDFKGKKVSFD